MMSNSTKVAPPSAPSRLTLIATMLSLVAVAVAVAVSGCSAGQAQHTPSPGFTSVKNVAAPLKCTDYSGNYGEPGTSDSATCKYEADILLVAWFTSAPVAKSYRRMIEAQHRTDSFVWGTNWSIECSLKSACASAHTVLGGELVKGAH